MTTLRRTAAAFFTMFVVADQASLTAQEVMLSEVCASEHWIEVHNRGTASVELSTWSLLFATRTASYVHSHWWGFPTGTTLAAGAFLRVNWFVTIPATGTPAELFTGTSPYMFLFGLGGAPLDGARGAVGLLDSQQNAQMNNPAIVRDWLSWGESGLPREDLAVQAGFWTANQVCPAIPFDQSLARDVATIGLYVSRHLEWFVDPTPTPLSPNTTGAVVSVHGQPCAVPGHHLLGAPQLRAMGLPLLGNQRFGYSIEHTTGIFGESMLLVFSSGSAPAGLPSLLPHVGGSSCSEGIDVRRVLAVAFGPTSPNRTEFPLSLANLPVAMSGLELHSQALVFDWLPNAWPPFQGLTNALLVVVGR